MIITSVYWSLGILFCEVSVRVFVHFFVWGCLGLLDVSYQPQEVLLLWIQDLYSTYVL